MKKEKNKMSLPDMITLDSVKMSEAPEEIISGVLHRGHLMQVIGPREAGKSCLLMELAAAIAEGKDWLGFKCRKGNVLYVNMDMEKNSCIRRYLDVYKALNLRCNDETCVEIWNLRENSQPLDELLHKLLERVRGKNYSAVIIDPIQRLLPCKKNDIADILNLSNTMDQICEETGAAVIYVNNNPDISDELNSDTVIELQPVSVEDKNHNFNCETAARHFPEIKPFDVSFEYPVHRKEEEDVQLS